MLKPVLIILHQEHSSPGRVGQAAAASSAISSTSVARASAIPAGDHGRACRRGDLRRPDSANDESDFIRREIDWIGVPLATGKPYLGICLGAQMMARHLGGRVYPHPQGRAEVGYYPIRPTQAGRADCADWPDRVYQWHREGFDLPAGGELLAEGDDFAVQAFRYRHRLCAAIPPGSHPRHDVPLAGARRASDGASRRQAARTSTSPTARCTTMPRATGSPPSSITGSAASRARRPPVSVC